MELCIMLPWRIAKADQLESGVADENGSCAVILHLEEGNGGFRGEYMSQALGCI